MGPRRPPGKGASSARRSRRQGELAADVDALPPVLQSARPNALSPVVAGPQSRTAPVSSHTAVLKAKGKARELSSEVADENASPSRPAAAAASHPQSAAPSSSSSSAARPGARQQSALGFKVGKPTPLSASKTARNAPGRSESTAKAAAPCVAAFPPSRRPPPRPNLTRDSLPPSHCPPPRRLTTGVYQPPPSPTPNLKLKLSTKDRAKQRALEQTERERAVRATKEREKTGGGLRGWLTAGAPAGSGVGRLS